MPDSTKTRCILRFDHRVPFVRTLFGIEEGQRPDQEQRAQICDYKKIAYEALIELANANGLENSQVVAVLDEEYSSAIADDARSRGIPVGLSVERSGRPQFEFEYGDDFAAHIERFRPDYVKALARYNPGGDAAMNESQRGRLAELSAWAAANGYPLMFELLIPPTEEQLARATSEPAFERELLPGLVAETIDAFRSSNINAALWMVPGFAETEAYSAASAHLRRLNGDDVECIVLGQGPDAERVLGWMERAGKAEGYDGIALAQTIWMPPLKAYKAGSLTRDQARSAMVAGLQGALSAYGH